MSKLMVKVEDIWVPMEGLKGDTGPLPADETIPDTALVTDGAKTNTAYLMHNRLTKDASGELISVEDAYAVPPVSFGVDGKSTQVSTTGKNLLSDVPSEWVKRTFSGLSGTHVSFPISIEDGVSYYYVNTTGTGMSPGMYAGFCDTLEGEITVYDRVTITNYNSRTFTNTGNHPYLIFFAAGANTTATQLTNQFKSYKIFLSANSSDTYEVYSGGAASPRPDWPQEIVSTNEVTLVTTNKNLAIPTETAVTKVSNGVTFEWDGEKLNASGTLTNNNVDSARITITNAPVMFAGNTYRFSFHGTFDTGGSGTTFYFHTSKRGETSTTLRYIFGGANQRSWKYTPAEDMVLRSIVLRISKSGSTVNISARIQLELGSTSTEYEPYSGVTATIDLSEEPLRSLPDGTKDELNLTYLRPSTRKGWAFYKAEKMQRVTTQNCSGNEGWKKYSNYAFYKAMPNARVMKTGRKELLCDAYKSDVSTSLGSARTAVTSPNTIFGRYGETDAIIKTSVAYDTVNDFKAALAENPIVIQYALATPQTIDFGEIELPIMQSGTTNIWTDPSTNLSVTYERDRNVVITNLKAAVADLATS